MEQLKRGTRIKTSVGQTAVVEKLLASGGQGDVYVVSIGGSKKAMKWYKPTSIDAPKPFFDNLVKNAAKGSPNDSFLWPLAVAGPAYDSFGYIMNLRPEEYAELADYMVGNVKFSTFKAAIESCIRIVSAFRIIHQNGYCYQDLSDGNFFINPKTGEVLICDNDNVAPNGIDSFILGTPRYMAPEIVCGTAQPNTQTDRFSLAVILFMIICMNHPLEGKHWLVPCLTPSHERKLYGEQALFIYDRDDSSNRPVRGVHSNVVKRWSCLPDYMKQAFQNAFGKEAIENPAARLRETDWLKLLTRFQSDIVRCPSCGGEIFIQGAASTVCDGCGRKYEVEHTIELPDCVITAARGTRVYLLQMRTCNPKDALTPVGLVVGKDGDPKALGFRNVSNDAYEALTPSGKKRIVKPGEVVPLKAGITIDAFDSTLRIL